MKDHPLTPSDAPCPHCGRSMNRPSLERLSNPYCAGCLEERRAAAAALFAQPGTHVISPERTPEGITPGMREAAARIARSVLRDGGES
ncbi:hypothetical protein CTI14_02325 [Methylobacterium radiotolerans]|nr:hypothetical protein CTI14_02325 [Methylobacterium radiotolerans]